MRYYILILKAFRKIYSKIFRKAEAKLVCENNPEIAFQIMQHAIESDKPCMIARFGSTEMTCLCNYIGVQQSARNPINFIQGKSFPWWWEGSIINQMQQWSGFYPPTIDKIEAFCELLLEDMKELDVLGSWLGNEELFKDRIHAKKIHLRLLEPFWSEVPWTKLLKNKKVVVIHPFAETISKQYLMREKLFLKSDVLPEFKSFTVIKAVQSLGKGDERFKDWFEALDYMKAELDKVDYDVCLVGAGAYGFHLAAYAKRKGKKGIHIGGALQLFFGIRGKRWEDENYGVKAWGINKNDYKNLMNDFWVRPVINEKPKNAQVVEEACYW